MYNKMRKISQELTSEWINWNRLLKGVIKTFTRFKASILRAAFEEFSSKFTKCGISFYISQCFYDKNVTETEDLIVKLKKILLLNLI